MLFALFMLVLVLAVIATLSLANVTHQKMEMQVASDTAAYSQAVAAARTYNSVALLNRAQVATMVAMQGIHSVISFAGTYRGAVNATMYAYQDDFTKEFGNCSKWTTQINLTSERPENTAERQACELVDRIADETSCQRAKPRELNFWFFQITLPFSCSGEACDARNDIYGDQAFLNLDCANLGIGGNGRIALLKREWCRVKDVWNALDDDTGAQGKRAQAEAVVIGGLEAQALGKLQAELQGLATTSMNVIPGANPNTQVARAEVAKSYAGGGSQNGLDVALGSRAHPFISNRADGQRAIEEQLRLVVAPSGASPDEIQVINFLGNSFFNTPGWGASTYAFSHGDREPDGHTSWADEHGQVSVSYLGPRQNQRTPGVANTRHARTFRGSQGSTDLQNSADTHEWCPADLNAESRDPSLRHTLLEHQQPPPNEPDPCAPPNSCIWPAFYDVNAELLTNAADVFGQPKLLTVATKDLAGQKDPWNLMFGLRFGQNSGGANIDFSQKHAVGGFMPEFQTISAGMAYYHRPGVWKEHPNLFNPYWRATLVRANVDDTWQADLTSKLAPQNASALTQLLGVNYRGIP